MISRAPRVDLCRSAVESTGRMFVGHTLDHMVVPVYVPLERLLDGGAREVDTEALLAMVLQGATVDRDTLADIARHIDGDWPGIGAGALGRAEVPADVATMLSAVLELARRVAAPRPPEVIRGPADVAAIACREIGGLRRERVLVVVCDPANRPRQTVVVCDGAIDRSLMPVREILNAVLRRDGRAFAIAHNHPCGDPKPSDADIAATRRVADGARLVGLRFLGHVVVGDGRWAAIAT
ncbi:MAG: JAB domain-containing protein [Solirubrobacteraceae bacterium]